MRTWWIAGGVALAACGTPTPSDGIESGSRLVAHFLAAEGGARQFQTWHDTELDLDCFFTGDPIRCVPSDISGSSLFGDAQCATPLLTFPRGPSCTPVPAFVATYFDQPCTYGFAKIWHVGAKVAPAQVYVLDGTGACVAAAVDPGTDYYTAGAELALGDLVGAEERHEGDGEVEADVVVADDGARQPWGMWSKADDAYCWDLDGRCVSEWQFAWQFDDDACSELVAGGYECNTTQPARIGHWESDGTGCGGSYRVFHGGGSVTPTAVYYDNGDSCAPDTLGTAPYWSVGGEIPLDSYPALERKVGGGSARIQPYVIEGGGYSGVEWGYRDNTLGVDCYPTEVSPGEWRCQTNDVAGVDVGVFFTDAQCRIPIDIVRGYSDTCAGTDPAPPRAGYVTVSSDDGCSYSYELHEVGDEVMGLYFLDGTGACAPNAPDRASVRFYAVGDEIGWGGYALFREATD